MERLPNRDGTYVLRAVDSNGEVQSSEEKCADCVGYERDLRSKRLRIGLLEKRLSQAEGTDPDAPEVRAVLDYWATRVVEEGWWQRKPAYRPGHARWTMVGSRLKEPEYDIDYCMTVVEGALTQSRWSCNSCGSVKPKREWLDALSLFREGNIEKHYERARDEHMERVKALRKLPPELQDADLTFLTQRCDCGHLRMEHSKPDPWREHRTPCLMDCWCDGFSDYEHRVEKHPANGHRSHTTLMKTKEQQGFVDTLFDVGEACKSE